MARLHIVLVVLEYKLDFTVRERPLSDEGDDTFGHGNLDGCKAA